MFAVKSTTNGFTYRNQTSTLQLRFPRILRIANEHLRNGKRNFWIMLASGTSRSTVPPTEFGSGWIWYVVYTAYLKQSTPIWVLSFVKNWRWLGTYCLATHCFKRVWRDWRWCCFFQMISWLSTLDCLWYFVPVNQLPHPVLGLSSTCDCIWGRRNVEWCIGNRLTYFCAF